MFFKIGKKRSAVLLMGGLGNQIFQYAFAKAWALTNNKPYELNVSFLKESSANESFTKRHYELGVFEMNPQISDTPIIWGSGLSNRYLRFAITRVSELYVLREKKMRFSPEYLKARNKRAFIGYFQTEKYFARFRSEILKDLRFKSNFSDKTKEVAQDIAAKESVSLHVRRGDYLTMQVNLSSIGVCSLDYYKDAISYIGANVKDPEFYVFSDDIKWARENIDVKGRPVHFIDHNSGSRSFEDMYLMSLCKHNIIANSSFSWWGAWLNQNPNKIVTAPKRWFANPGMDSTDIIPESWISL